MLPSPAKLPAPARCQAIRPRTLTALAVLGVLATGCYADEEALDLCEEAALHRQACLGEYITPPICEGAAAADAEHILSLQCSDLAALDALERSKADGPLCDWFGTGCAPDEPIFQGASCTSDHVCAAGSFCVEGHCFAGAGSDEFASVLDEYTATAETVGAQVRLLDDNDETRAIRLALVEHAEHSVHLASLYLADDLTGRESVAALAAAAQRGIEVRVILDSASQQFWGDSDLLDDLHAAGVEVLGFNPVLAWARLRWSIGMWSDQRIHEKILVVDGEHAVVGGRNISDRYLVSDIDGWRDTCVFMSGPGVGDVQRMFLELWDKVAAWEHQAGCGQGLYCVDPRSPKLATESAYYPDLPARTSARTRAIYSDPHAQDTSLGYFTKISLVRAARESIVISNAYFVPPRRLRKHLREAVDRGVRVVMLTNSKESASETSMYYAGINYYRELIDAGVEVREWRGPASLHAKTMVVDGELALVSSFNLDPRSAERNSEALILIRDSEVVRELSDSLARDVAQSDLARYDNIPWADWLKARALRLAEPLL
jgi:cardiolipin synthase A/B